MVNLREREPVYIRSFSTRRAAVAQVLGVVSVDGKEWVRVRLVTDCYDWDNPEAKRESVPRSGEELLVAPLHLEAIRR